MNKYISNHPFIFLISLMVIASFCLGGFLGVAHAGKLPVEATLTTPAPATETAPVYLSTITEATPPGEAVTPTDTPSIEIAVLTATSSIEVGFPTATTTSIPEKTVTSQPTIPSPTVEATVPRLTNPLVVHFINIGQGDSVLILSQEGMTILIDGGSANTGVVAYLRGLGIYKIDLMVATHPHEDHIGGLTQVLEAMPVSRVVTNGEAYTTAAYEHFLDAILSSGAEYSEAKGGDTISLGGLTFLVLNPGGYLGDDPNENSIVGIRYSFEGGYFENRASRKLYSN
jgi:Metallo-beta-lactamase superfamily